MALEEARRLDAVLRKTVSRFSHGNGMVKPFEHRNWIPINLKMGFLHLLQARKYCLDANIAIKKERSADMQQALQAVLQYCTPRPSISTNTAQH